jgi:hypothetical protein
MFASKAHTSLAWGSSMRSTGQPTRVHKAPPGFFYAPMPDKVKGTKDREGQGGFPPVPYRSRNDWSAAGRYAGEPWNSNPIRGEVMSSRKDLNP